MRAAFALVAVLAAVLLAACNDGPYSAPPGQFYCGSTDCDVSSEICVLAPADGGGRTAGCAPVASACSSGTPACTCAMSLCAGTCSQASDGSVTLTCSN